MTKYLVYTGTSRAGKDMIYYKYIHDQTDLCGQDIPLVSLGVELKGEMGMNNYATFKYYITMNGHLIVMWYPNSNNFDYKLANEYLTNNYMSSIKCDDITMDELYFYVKELVENEIINKNTTDLKNIVGFIECGHPYICTYLQNFWNSYSYDRIKNLSWMKDKESILSIKDNRYNIGIDIQKMVFEDNMEVIFWNICTENVDYNTTASFMSQRQEYKQYKMIDISEFDKILEKKIDLFIQ
jgi:hypothetical protein